MDTSFLNLVRGNRLTSYMGLQMLHGHAYKYAPDYTYLEIPVLGFQNKDGEVEDKALRNQYVRVVPACLLDVKGLYKVQVEPNPALAEFGLFQPTYYLHPGSGGVSPGFYFHARKDTDTRDLPFAVRLYLRG